MEQVLEYVLGHRQTLPQVLLDTGLKETSVALEAILEGDPPAAVNIGDRPGQVFKHVANTDKVKKRLDWQPTIGFDEGMRRTVEWYLANRYWWQPKVWMRHVPILTVDGKVELH